MDWFRMYGEFATDSKVQMMSEAMQRRLMMLFCLRCSNTLVTLQDEEIAFALRICDADLAETKALFMRKNFINEAWEIMGWDKRQYASDSSAARVARHRANKKAEAVTPSNVTVSAQNRADTEQIQNRTEEQSAVPAPHAPTAVDISVAMRQAGLATQPADPRLIELAKQGVTTHTVLAACDEAKRAKPGEKVSVGYVLAILKRWGNEAKALTVAGAAPPGARASPGYQSAAQHAKSFADRLTGRTQNARPDDHKIIDLNDAPA